MAPLIDRAVVMRDGRIAYDGPPLASAEVATAHLDGHHHHHHAEPERHDHAPHVSSPDRAVSAMSDFLDLLGLHFMQRAIIAAVFTGLAAPAVGTYLVQRRLALMGDGIGHVAVTGVALGLLTGTSPTWTAVIVAIARRDPDRGDPRARPRQRRRRAGAALLRRSRRRRAAHRARRAERRHPAALPLRLDHDDRRSRRDRGDGARGGRRAGLRRPVTAALRGRPGPGVRPGRRASTSASTTCWSPCSPPSA